MLAVATDLHIQDPTKSGQRFLVGGNVIAAEGQETVAEFHDARFLLESGQNVIVFFERKRQFLQQTACVRTLRDAERGLCCGLELTGEPVSAENREHYRVSTAAADYQVSLDGRSGLHMVDVSITGFAAIAEAGHTVGMQLEAGIRLAGRSYNGPMVVQSVRDLGRLGVRYGLRVPDGDGDRSGLTVGIRDLALQAEREMLRRVSKRD